MKNSPGNAAPSRVLMATMGPSEADHTVPGRPVQTFDLYELSAPLLESCGGLILSLNCDQLFLSGQGALLANWVRAGGRVLVNGHVHQPSSPDSVPGDASTTTAPAICGSHR